MPYHLNELFYGTDQYFQFKNARGQPSNTKSEMWRKEIEQKKESNQNYIVLFHLV